MKATINNSTSIDLLNNDRLVTIDIDRDLETALVVTDSAKSITFECISDAAEYAAGYIGRADLEDAIDTVLYCMVDGDEFIDKLVEVQ